MKIEKRTRQRTKKGIRAGTREHNRSNFGTKKSSSSTKQKKKKIVTRERIAPRVPCRQGVLYTQDATWECHISLWQVASCVYAHRIQVNTYHKSRNLTKLPTFSVKCGRIIPSTMAHGQYDIDIIDIQQ